ncbi:DUF5977 domain-containing protein [Rhizosphaericola mali]|uniref:DUF5977 domain-containing protein n=1 Tax=Rhizosphaericola mali TaxID=2545455 RepID=A0A5P2GB31_9BACT|nr:DUF5977 domain-containing protein [Rhizosphaericola mali]QES88761.1 hypothetical protein E0W69_008890 [Rhizosphaericola mali]
MHTRLLQILVLILIFSIYQSSAQVIPSGRQAIPKVIASSPQAASLGSYGVNSINMFTGKPTIDLNLYSITQGDFTLPISLSYNSDLIKPQEHAGIMGLGWILNAGGVINRSVNEGVDEILVGNGESPDNKYSYYDNYGTLNNSSWSTTSFLQSLGNGFAYVPSGTYANTAHPNPDVFNFSVGSISGSFYKNQVGQWVISSSTDIDFKIEDTLASNYQITEKIYGGNASASRTISVKRIIYGFTITDDKGIKYVFGRQPGSIEFSANAMDGTTSYNENYIANAWYLTKVILPNSNYSYTLAYSMDNSPIFKVYPNFAAGNYKVNNGSGSYQNVNYAIVRNYQTYLTSITSPDMEIDFYRSHSNDLDYKIASFNNTNKDNWSAYGTDYGPYSSSVLTSYDNVLHWYKLDSMIVKSLLSGQKINKVVPTYFENSNSRLFLTGLSLYGSDTSMVKRYQFGYNSGPLPSTYQTMELDDWGNFNGKDFFNSVAGDSSLVYSVNQFKNIYPTYRKPSMDLNIAGAGYLTSITYPTGGTDNIEYELNSYSKYVTGNASTISFDAIDSTHNVYTGGLRVHKITTLTGDSSKPLVRTFFYQRDYLGGDTLTSGVVAGVPSYFESGTDNNQFNYYKFKITPVLIDNSTNGAHVTYSRVYEKGSDGSLTQYDFTNHDNGFGDRPALSYTENYITYDINGKIAFMNKLKYNSMAHERGKPLSIKYYDSAAHLLKSESYNYFLDSVTTDTRIHAVEFQSEMFGKPTEGSMSLDLSNMFEALQLSAYIPYSYHSHLASKTTTMYYRAGSDSLQETQRFTYNIGNTHQLRTLETMNSKGKSTREGYKYPTDFTGNTVYNAMVGKNMLSSIVEDTNSVNNAQTVLSRTNYQAIYPISGTQTPLFYLPYSYQTQLGSATLSVDDSILAYTYKGDIAEVKHRDGMRDTYIWGYNFQYPVARIHSQTVTYTTAIAAMGGSWSSSNSPYLSDADMRTALNNLRSALSSSGADIFTYTHNPLIGITSETDPTGKISYYQYDPLGRLIRILDNDKNIVRTISYNYRNGSPNLIYKNTAKSGSFTVNTCSANLTGETVTYTVAAGKYESTVSQAAADQLAQNDVDTNGQNYANSNGGCKALISINNINMFSASVMGVLNFIGQDSSTYSIGASGSGTSLLLPTGAYTVVFNTPGANALIDVNGTQKVVNTPAGGATTLGNFSIYQPYTITGYSTYYGNTAQSQIFTKNNCASGLQGSQVTYTVSANSYYSSISQSDANQKATANINANGQTYANNVGTCSALVSITLQKTSSVSTFNPVTVQISSSGNSNIGTYNFPSSNTGSTTISLPAGTYQLKFTLPSTTPYNVPFTLNGSQIANIASGLTTTGSATLSAGTNYTLKAVIGR